MHRNFRAHAQHCAKATRGARSDAGAISELLSEQNRKLFSPT